MLRIVVAVTGVAAIAAIAACRGEAPTGPDESFAYDLVIERRDGPSGPPDLYLLDLRTGEERRVLPSGLGGKHPHGSPDGERIAFVRSDAEFNDEIMIVNRQGSGAINVSNHAQPDIMPAWSPAGGRIAFVTDRAGFQDIFVVNSDGTNVRRVTPEDPSPAVTTEWWPAWSPNGQLIAYSSTIDGTADIWTITVDAPTIARGRLTGTIDSDLHPTWSSDGTRIAFERRDASTGESDIFILTLATLTLQRIPLPGQQVSPAWSPEGTLIAFASNHEDLDDLEIYTMRPDGTDVRRRTSNGATDLHPTWLLRQQAP